MITVKWWAYVIAIAATLSAVGASYVLTYTKGYHAAESAYKARMSALEAANLRKLIQQEREAAEKQDLVVEEYIEQINQLREDHANAMVEMDKLRDVIIFNPSADCVPGADKSSTAGVPAKTAVKPGLKCYTDAELRRKIESSMALAREADELALRYAALVKACGQ